MYFASSLNVEHDILCMDVSPRHMNFKKSDLDMKNKPKAVRVFHTDVETELLDEEVMPSRVQNSVLHTSMNTSNDCPLHQSNTHQLKDCEHFKDMKFSTKKLIVGKLFFMLQVSWKTARNSRLHRDS